MSEYGVTDQGFKKKSREQIEENMKLKARNLFGDNWNVGRRSVTGILIKLISFPLALVWSSLEKLYNSFHINTATGQALDELVVYLGLERLEASRASGFAKFSGDDGVEIPEGFVVETDESEPIRFETTETGIIENNSLELDINAIEPGEEGNVGSNAITEIANPISGLDEVNNPVPTTGGRNRETDTELRERYKRSTDLAGGGTASAIQANILQETEASACIVVENLNKDLIYKDNIPPRALEPVVLAPTGEEVEISIAEAILDVISVGIPSVGDIVYFVSDDAGQEKEIGFSRGSGIEIHIHLDLSTDDNFPTNGTDLIENDILNYISNLSLGEKVIQSKIIDLAHDTAGVIDIEVFLGISPDPTEKNNIEIEDREVAVSDEEKITFEM